MSVGGGRKRVGGGPADEEIVAVYDEYGAVIGAEPRSAVYANGLWHASAGVLVRSADGRSVYVHKRSTTKSVFAGLYDALAGGVVDPGETAASAAARELEEELGVTNVRLRTLGSCAWQGRWHALTLRCHVHAFQAAYSGTIVHQPEEIEDGWWWPCETLCKRLADPDRPFAPDTRVVLESLPPGALCEIPTGLL